MWLLYSIANDLQTGSDPQIEPQMIPRLKMLPRPQNDPQTRNDPQIELQMILDVDHKWSRRKTRNDMEFVPRVEVLIFNLNRHKLEVTI